MSEDGISSLGILNALNQGGMVKLIRKDMNIFYSFTQCGNGRLICNIRRCENESFFSLMKVS